MKVYSTVANEAEKSINEIIGHKNQIYKPWQLSEHKSENIRLCTTLDEMKLLWNEPIYVRPGFEVDDELVTIPNFLTKLSYNDTSFIEMFEKFVEENENKGIVYKHIDYLNSKLDKKINRSKIEELLNEEGLVDVEKYMISDLNTFKYMRIEYQKSIADKINKVLLSKDKLILNHIEVDKYRVIHILLNIDETLYDLYHHFDYQYLNPKILIIDNQKETMNSDAAIRVLFLLSLGFDIFVVAPKGYASLENVLEKQIYDLHYDFKMNDPDVKVVLEKGTMDELIPYDKSRRKKIYGTAVIVFLIFIFLLSRSNVKMSYDDYRYLEDEEKSTYSED